MVSRVKRYFLEIKDFSKTVDLNLPENFQIILDDKDNFHLNRFFYKQIGVDHYWRDRLLWSDSEWVKYVTNKNLETHVLKKGEDLVGYYEQEYHPGSNEVELNKAVTHVANLMGAKDKGYRALTNIGGDGGQEVPHLHFHIFAGEKIGKMVS